MKKPVISMRLHKEDFILINGEKIKPVLPDGCMGVMFAFDSKKSARKFDPKAALVEIEPAGAN